MKPDRKQARRQDNPQGGMTAPQGENPRGQWRFLPFMLMAFKRLAGIIRIDRSTGTQAGISLFELTAVLAVVAAVGVVAVANRPGLEADAFADGETLRGAIRATRTRAMADVVSWSFVVAGQTGTYQRNGVAKATVQFATPGVAPGTVTFDTRGEPSGTLSFAVAGYSRSPVTVTAGTGYVP